MKKILIVAKDDFTEQLYSNIFSEEGFETITTQSGQEALTLVKQKKPDAVLTNINLKDISGFDLLKNLQANAETKRIPVVIFTNFEKAGDKQKAVELEAKDFIISAKVTPRDIVLRMRTLLGEEKTYQIPIENKSDDLIELSRDLGYKGSLTCMKCGAPLEMYLMRDFRRGEDYFKISFICPRCSR